MPLYDIACAACHQAEERFIRLSDFDAPIVCAWCGGDCKRVLNFRVQVMKDIEPYKSVVTGEMIQGRRQHRDHLRAHGLIEIGNERAKPMKHDTAWIKPALRETYNHLRLTGKI